jgi:hypothetical protein
MEKRKKTSRKVSSASVGASACTISMMSEMTMARIMRAPKRALYKVSGGQYDA